MTDQMAHAIEAATQRAHAKQLVVSLIWDSSREQSAWKVRNPKTASVHYVHIDQHNRLICDCQSRVYCCCRAAVREHLAIEAQANAAKEAAQQREQAVRDARREAAVLARPAARAFSIFKCE